MFSNWNIEEAVVGGAPNKVCSTTSGCNSTIPVLALQYIPGYVPKVQDEKLLFLFLMITFAKTLEDEWTALGLSKAQFLCKDNSPRSTGKLVIHRPGTFSSGILINLLCMLCVDNGAFF